MQVGLKVVFNRKNKLNRNGQALIQIEVYLEGNRKYFNTGIYVTPEEYKPNIAKCIYVSDGYKNSIILDKLQELRSFERKFRINNEGRFSLSEFDVLNQPKPVKPVLLTFTEFYAQQLEIEKKNIEFVTWQQQKTNLDFLKDYCPVILPLKTLRTL